MSNVQEIDLLPLSSWDGKTFQLVFNPALQ